jgi:rSAM/selenodomain-associated transferase 1
VRQQDGFARGYKKIVVIGSDCPAVSQELIIEALRKLDLHDVVIGPATDGGYYLVGLRQTVPELFSGIAWSTDQVLSQTLKLCSSQRLSPALLPELRDIDQIEDLVYYREQGLLL